MGALHTRLRTPTTCSHWSRASWSAAPGCSTPARPVPFDRTLERYGPCTRCWRTKRPLLAKGRNDWMGQGTLQLGPAYQKVLQRVERTRLFGPEVLQELQNRSGTAFAEFRRQFELAFRGHGEPGIVWLAGEQRFGLSSDRAALRARAGRAAEDLLHGGRSGARRPAKREPPRCRGPEARALAEERTRRSPPSCRSFPSAQPVVTRVMDARVSELIYQRAFRMLKTSFPRIPPRRSIRSLSGSSANRCWRCRPCSRKRAKLAGRPAGRDAGRRAPAAARLGARAVATAAAAGSKGGQLLLVAGRAAAAGAGARCRSGGANALLLAHRHPAGHAPAAGEGLAGLGSLPAHQRSGRATPASPGEAGTLQRARATAACCGSTLPVAVAATT